uniref:Uncharacterized protein LOC105133477 n=1 Tax=Rhizophora mucronata TaxID=61149 RepID=A0A2P2J978_RHIMU
MSEIGGRSLCPCQQKVLFGQFSTEKRQHIARKREWQRHPLAELKERRPLVKNQVSVKPATYSSRITTDIPFHESPGASFDRYLENKPRVFEAIFPDKQRSQQLNEEEWRIQMLPINFLFLTVRPTVDTRLKCKSGGRDYPPEVPKEVAKVIELDITRWELQGLDDVFEPSHFELGVRGALYSERQGSISRLKGQLEMTMGLILPPMVALIPEDVCGNVADSVRPQTIL